REGAGMAEEQPGEERPARVGHEADRDERGNEAGRIGCDAEVTRERKRQPGPRGRAVDRREHGLLERADREDRRVVAGPQAVADVARGLPELRQVLADAEPTPG